MNWTRLYDDRIVTESSVFYPNGTNYDWVDGYGISNRQNFTQPLEDLLKQFKFFEEERGIFDEIPPLWTVYTNGTVITDQGYKWYPSGIVTTPNDEVFTIRATTIEQFIDKTKEDDGFVNQALSRSDVPADFTFRADGALIAPNGLIAYPDGWVATPDGFVASLTKMTFRDFATLYLETTTVELDNGRSWPRPLSTTEPVTGTETQNFLDSEWIFSLTEDADSLDFFKDWIFQLPKDWTLLPDGRVITNDDVVWFPNGITEELLIIE